MSKDDQKPDEKWREFSERDEAHEVVVPPADAEHLIAEESAEELLDNASRDKLGLLEKQVEFLKDQYARTQAELENMRRRMEQEVSKARKFGVERLVSDLVPVAESLSLGLDGMTSEDPAVKLLRQGSELTLDMLHKLLEKNGVVVINPQPGDAFDPSLHEAMSMVPNPDAKSNTVLQVLQKGYALHGRVIRAAMVIVAA
ncbi:MAG: nucleotide exchange factor GrpE [Coxiellaceae bacterium]|nr:nucleotide exchange factor GrpE [Coxiellaceae bacterium]